MPQRVLLMISSMRGGGSEQQTLLLLRHLDRSRFTPHLYLIEKAGPLLAQVPADVTVHSFEEVKPAAGWYVPGRVMRHQIRHLRELLRRHSIDVVYDRTFHMTMIAGPSALAVGVPRVSTIVSPPEYALPLVERRFVELKRRHLARAYRQAHRVVAVSQRAAESAEQYYGLPKDLIRVIRNPVDTEAIRHAAQANVPPRDERVTLVCVGRMSEEKGHRDLVEAIIQTQSRWPAGLPNLRLWMVGDGPLRNELESRWNRASTTHAIEFLGAQDCPASFIATADALVLPSHFEGMPNVALEAMALGTPVIATRAGGTVELEREEPTILWAQPNQPESLAEAIVQFAGDRESARTRALAAAAMIAKHHDVQTATDQIQGLLEAACRPPTQRPGPHGER